MREKIILVCEECLSRNYSTTKNKALGTKRLEIKKHCPKCNKHTVHKETKQTEDIMAIKEKKNELQQKSKVLEILTTEYKWETYL